MIRLPFVVRGRCVRRLNQIRSMRAINAQEILKNVDILGGHGGIVVGATRICRRRIVIAIDIGIAIGIALSAVEFSIASSMVRCMRINYLQVVICASAKRIELRWSINSGEMRRSSRVRHQQRDNTQNTLTVAHSPIRIPRIRLQCSVPSVQLSL